MTMEPANNNSGSNFTQQQQHSAAHLLLHPICFVDHRRRLGRMELAAQLLQLLVATVGHGAGTNGDWTDHHLAKEKGTPTKCFKIWESSVKIDFSSFLEIPNQCGSSIHIKSRLENAKKRLKNGMWFFFLGSNLKIPWEVWANLHGSKLICHHTWDETDLARWSWLVVFRHPSEKWWSSSFGMMRFPIYGKMKKMATKPPTSEVFMAHQIGTSENNTTDQYWSMSITERPLKNMPKICPKKNMPQKNAEILPKIERSTNPTISETPQHQSGKPKLAPSHQIFKFDKNLNSKGNRPTKCSSFQKNNPPPIPKPSHPNPKPFTQLLFSSSSLCWSFDSRASAVSASARARSCRLSARSSARSRARSAIASADISLAQQGPHRGDRFRHPRAENPEMFQRSYGLS